MFETKNQSPLVNPLSTRFLCNLVSYQKPYQMPYSEFNIIGIVRIAGFGPTKKVYRNEKQTAT